MNSCLNTMKRFNTFLKLSLLETFLLSCVCVIGSLTSCNDDDCGGSNAALSTFDIVISYVGSDSGENLLEVDGIPVPKDSVQITREVPEETTTYEHFTLRSSPQFADLGTYLSLQYEARAGTTNFIITVSQYEADTISFHFEKNKITIFHHDSLFHSYEVCNTWNTPSLIISK